MDLASGDNLVDERVDGRTATVDDALSAENRWFMLVSERSCVRPLISPRFVSPHRSLPIPTTLADNSSKQQSRAALVVVPATATGPLRARLAVARRAHTADHRPPRTSLGPR
jgi:hypothetical protein